MTLWASWVVQEGGANVYYAGCVFIQVVYQNTRLTLTVGIPDT